MGRACHICGAPADRARDPQYPHDYYFCTGCGFVGSSKNLAPDLEKAQYLRHNNSPENAGYVDMFKRFIDVAVLPFARGGRALDYGCGYAPVLARLLAENGFEVTAYDPYFFPLELETAGVFDLIVSTEVFEHFYNPVRQFQRICALLAPGGVLSVMTRFAPASQTEFFNWWYRHDITHVCFYTPRSFELLAAASGLSVLFCDGKSLCVMKKGAPL